MDFVKYNQILNLYWSYKVLYLFILAYFKSFPFILKQQICVITTYSYTISMLRKSKCTINWIMMTLDITLNYVTSLKGYDLIFVKVIEPHFCWALKVDFSRKLGSWTNFESTWAVCLNTSCLKNVRWTEMCFLHSKTSLFFTKWFLFIKAFHLFKNHLFNA